MKEEMAREVKTWILVTEKCKTKASFNPAKGGKSGRMLILSIRE